MFFVSFSLPTPGGFGSKKYDIFAGQSRTVLERHGVHRLNSVNCFVVVIVLNLALVVI